MMNLEKETQKLRRENERLRAALKDARERIDYLIQWRDAFSEDFLRGYKEQIEKKHGIYRCDMCINSNDNEYKPTGTCSKLKCDGYSHWEWRGFKYENTVDT